MKLTSNQREKIAELYLLHFTSLMHYAYANLQNVSLAEEIVHDVFLIACMKYNEFSKSYSQEGWLKLTLKYLLKNAARKTYRAGKLFAMMTPEDLHTAVVPADLSVLFDMDMKTELSLEEYHLYQLVYVDGEALKDVAKQLGISPAACKKRIQRLKNKLKNGYFSDGSRL